MCQSPCLLQDHATAGLVAGKLLGLSAETVLGIFTGTLASSSSLAILIGNGWGGSMWSSYGLTYPVGMVGIILFVQLTPALLHKNLEAERKKLAEEKPEHEEHLHARKFIVENPAVVGRSLAEIALRARTGATLSRVRRRGRIIIPNASTVLREGDVVLAVGAEEALQKAHDVLGNETHDDMESDPMVEARPILVTNPSLHNVSLEHLGLPQTYHVVVTRVWRSGVELIPTGEFHLELGDTALSVGKKANLDRLTTLLGTRGRDLGELDLLSMAFGMAAGILMGKITIPLPCLGSISVGNAGGALFVGMLLGYLRRVGFLTGIMSPRAKQILKELGLSLFLAGIGTRAGAGFVSLDTIFILKVMGTSIFLLFSAIAITYLFCRKILKMGFIQSLACVCGGLISTPGAAALVEMTKSDEPSYVFANCYPVALIITILGSQLLAAVAPRLL